MYIPNYQGESSLNMIASIQKYCGVQPQYPIHRELSNNYFSSDKALVFFFVDGLGYKWLQTYGDVSYLAQHLIGKLDGIFPSTTSAVTTSFATGLSPSEHAIMGWWMYSPEVATIISLLPWQVKSPRTSL